MKITNLFRAAVFAAGILFMSVSSCGRFNLAEEAVVDCEPEYVPSMLVPGTNCRNYCMYVYEGTIDLVTGQWEINCEMLDLVNHNLKVILDNRIVSDMDGHYLPTLRFQLFMDRFFLEEIGEGRFCRRDAFVRSGDQEAQLKFISYPLDGGVMTEMLATFEEPVERVNFRIFSTRPLPLGEEERGKVN